MLRDDLEYQRREYMGQRDQLLQRLDKLREKFDDYSDALSGLNSKIVQLEDSRSNAKTTIRTRMEALNPMSRFRTWYVEHVDGIFSKLDSQDGFSGMFESQNKLKSELRNLDEAISNAERDCQWLDNEIYRLSHEINSLDMEAGEE